MYDDGCGDASLSTPVATIHNWLGLPHFHTGYKVPHGVNLFCAHLENLLISSDIVTSIFMFNV